MIENKKHQPWEYDNKIIVTLATQGNAFYLMGLAKRISQKIGIEYNSILDKMMSGDYENLIRVFEENFSDFVILEK